MVAKRYRDWRFGVHGSGNRLILDAAGTAKRKKPPPRIDISLPISGMIARTARVCRMQDSCQNGLQGVAKWTF